MNSKEIRASFTTVEEKINQMVKDYILEKFKEEYSDPNTPRNDQDKYHLAHCHETRVIDSDVEWECLCYSEYTREDNMQLLTRIACSEVTAVYSWQQWGNIPDILQQLYDRSRREDLPKKCDYEGDD